MEHLSKSEFANLCAVSRSAISRAIGRHRVVVNPEGIAIDHFVNAHYAMRCLLRMRRDPSLGEQADHLAAILAPYTDIDTPTSCPRAREMTEVAQRLVIAGARIKEEKAKQEEIKTREKCRSLAPIGLVRYFDGFCIDLKDNFDTLHSLEDELAQLFTSGKSRAATQLIVRELEAIVVQCRDRLVDAIGRGSTLVS